ncbi:hypothetical protein [Sedimentibacter saalensis]|uniref:hypothetical protein n=1 Tax=Sedimentibacter saalensis TaxID=130788 RepID=UPI00289DED25|nr:hypothetical protein [Sedimentibacter saalensis]
MSAFLGPIHFWLYNKIKIQNNIVEEILDFSEEKGLNLRKDLYSEFGDGDLKELDQVIDTSNIHGWLQDQIIKVENKLAISVTQIINKNSDSIKTLKDIFYNNGVKASALNENSSVEEAFKSINDTLLDGMPCDHALGVISQDENEAVWKRYECVHSRFWEAAKGDIAVYYSLRDEFIKGLVEKANLNYEKIDETTSKIFRR